MNNSRVKFGIITLSLFFHQHAWAVCTSPPSFTSLSATGKTGEIQMSAGSNKLNKLMYCDGTSWNDLPGSNTPTSCSKNGEIKMNGSDLQYCNVASGTFWSFDSAATSAGACSVQGQFQMSGSNLQYCDGALWRLVSKTDITPDSVSSPDVTTTNDQIEVGRAGIFGPISGTTGATVPVTFSTASCASANAKVCPDIACTSFLQFLSVDGSLTVPAGAYIRFGFFSSSSASVTCSVSASIGSQTIKVQSTTTSSDISPSISPLPADLYNQTSNTYSTSDIMKVSAHTGITASIADNGTGGTPEFRVCADASCSTVDVAWTSSPQSLSNPKWVQMRVLFGSPSNDMKYVTLNLGSSAVKWFTTVATCPYTSSVASGTTVTCSCPSNTNLLAAKGSIQGSLNYKNGAGALCLAAVHAGAVASATGGTVTIRGTTAGTPPGTCSSFAASTRNSVTSVLGTSGTSFYFDGFGSDVCN